MEIVFEHCSRLRYVYFNSKIKLYSKNLSSSPAEDHFNVSDVLDIIRFACESMPSFISSTPDFQVLTVNEQISLFIRNLHGVTSLYFTIFLRNADLLDSPQYYDSYITVYGSTIIQQLKHFLKRLDQDATLFKLMLLVITFSSNNIIVDVDENMDNDPLLLGTFRLYGSQNVYVELLWKYMLYRYGYYEAVIRFSGLVKSILDNMRDAAFIYMNNTTHHHLIKEVTEKAKEKLIIKQNEFIPLWAKRY